MKFPLFHFAPASRLARKGGLVTVAALLATLSFASAETAPDLEHWRAQRLEELKAADGWLSLVGRHWLKEGSQTVGTAKTNALVLAKGPAVLGTIVWDKPSGIVSLALNPEVHASVEGKPTGDTVSFSASEEQPTLVQVDTVSLQVITRGDRKVLRVKDSAAETRTHFAGLEYFPEDPAWKIEARWEAFSPPRTLQIQNIVGSVTAETVPGKAVFEYKGETYELWPIQLKGEESLFFVLSDQTSGQETYGGGRFLYADQPKNGKVLLDFNRAINPPCALTPFAACPLPPAQNRLKIRIAAGEKDPVGTAHP